MLRPRPQIARFFYLNPGGFHLTCVQCTDTRPPCTSCTSCTSNRPLTFKLERRTKSLGIPSLPQGSRKCDFYDFFDLKPHTRGRGHFFSKTVRVPSSRTDRAAPKRVASAMCLEEMLGTA